MEHEYEQRYYVCIDLKSFYASVECVERGLDPFTTNLVVADPSRGSGSICLAISPCMKAQGVRNRCRVYEIPANMEYITAKPRMKLYMQYSADIYATYLEYVSPDDVHVYSVDECFIDITPYAMLYQLSPKEMAKLLMQAVFDKFGICATAGVGTNMFLAKLALDVLAKHAPDFIGYLDDKEFKEQMWRHRPITDVWNIGKGIAKRLAKYGVYDLYGITRLDERLLYKEFGVNARYIIDHAWGRESCTMEEIHAYKPRSNSISNSQVLFENYCYEDALLVMKEMVDVLTMELMNRKLSTDGITLHINYSKECCSPTGATHQLGYRTSSYTRLLAEFEECYARTTNRLHPIRKIGVGLTNVLSDELRQGSLFQEDDQRERSMQQAMAAIKGRFGKNALLRGISYLDKATGRKRNKLVGGHNGE